MQVTIYAKKRTTKDGKKFFSYLTKLRKKDGSEVSASVKFREDCGQPDPKDCPMNITFNKGDANFSSKEMVNEETGEVFISNTLWVNNWEEGERYVDTSMDDFE